MPKFFSPSELTGKQKENWDYAIKAYERILELNNIRRFSDMNANDKKKFMNSLGIKTFSEEDVLNKIKSINMATANNPGDEKSALFFRLLSGKKILKNPPPLSYSYPNYDLIESNDVREVILDSYDIKKLILKKTRTIPYDHVIIDQSFWRVVEVISATKFHVTYRGWEKEGFIWEVELVEIPSSESKSVIIARHNPSLGKITKYKDLEKEAKFHAKNYFNEVLIALDEKKYKEYENEMIMKHSNFGKIMASEKLEYAQKLLEQRLKDGLPALATEEEIIEEAKKNLQDYLRDEYFDIKGILYKRTWTMKRISPDRVKIDYYYSDQELFGNKGYK